MSAAHCRKCGMPRNPTSTARCLNCGWLPPADAAAAPSRNAAATDTDAFFASTSNTGGTGNAAGARNTGGAAITGNAANIGKAAGVHGAASANSSRAGYPPVRPAAADAGFEAQAPEANEDIQAWNQFREVASIDSADQLLIDMLQVEQRAASFRDKAIGQFESAGPPERAGVLAGLADHIDTYITPLFDQAHAKVAAIDSPKAAQVREHLTTRQRVWQLLAEGLRRDDPRLMQAHQQVWHGVADVDLVKTAVRKAQHASADPATQTASFVAALSAFTPRLVVTPMLIVVNLVILAASLYFSRNAIAPNTDLLLDWGANFGPATLNGQWWRLFTSTFLHGSILHVMMNMWVLNDFGRLVERLVGNLGFLVVYVIAGLAGSMASLAWNPQVLSVGASGAVFGIGGVLLGWILLRRDSIPTPILSHLRTSVGVFIAYNFLGMFRGGNIDHAAHAGGFVAGVVCGMLISQPLGPQAVLSRWWKTLLTGGVGTAALLGVAFLLPPAPIDVRAGIQAFQESDRQALATFQSVFRSLENGQLSNVEFAERIERDILPAWAAARARLEKLRFEPLVNQDVLGKLCRYAEEREAAWRLFAAAARDDDGEKMKQAIAQWEAADGTARDISKVGKPD